MQTLLAAQDGIITRRQLHALGFAPHDLRRLIRRRDLTPVWRGVFVNHTGELSWRQRAWAAVLHHEPAALCHTSALHAHGHRPGHRTTQHVIHVAVDRQRSFSAMPGVRLHRVVDLEKKTLWNAHPPRLKVEEAAVDVAASARTEPDAVAVLADVVRERLTTADRLLQVIEGRARIPRRAFLAGVLRDVGSGTGSVLEHGYLSLVARAHGLPPGERQVRDAGASGTVFRDVLHADLALVIELDGRAFHDGATRRGADLGRDLAAAVQGLMTLRLGWEQTHGDPCGTAARTASVMQARGWSGAPRACGRPGCVVGRTDGGPARPVQVAGWNGVAAHTTSDGSRWDTVRAPSRRELKLRHD